MINEEKQQVSILQTVKVVWENSKIVWEKLAMFPHPLGQDRSPFYYLYLEYRRN